MTCVTTLVIVVLLKLLFPRNVPISDSLLKIDGVGKKHKIYRKTHFSSCKLQNRDDRVPDNSVFSNSPHQFLVYYAVLYLPCHLHKTFCEGAFQFLFMS